MKKILTIIFVLGSCILMAANTYVTTTGSDVTGTGTIGNPWATAKYGIEHTASGDTCIFGAGTFTISAPIALPIGVSFRGVDSTQTVFSVTFSSSGAIAAWSGTITNGNHHISRIKFDGNNLGYNAIHITRRSNVIIDKCAFKRFRSGAIYAMDGYDSYANSPAISGISVYNSQFVDCSRYLASGSYGAIWHRGVKDYSILNTTLIGNYLPSDSAGFLIKGSRIANVRISKCTMKLYNHDDGAKWAFAMEYNNVAGGIQIDTCDIQGVIDFSGDYCYKGQYDYSLWIHHNTIGHQNLSARWQDGIYLENYSFSAETYMGDVIIEDNTFRSLTRPIVFMKQTGGLQSQFRRITIQRNPMFDIGRDATGSNGMGISWLGAGGVFRDIFVYNNIFKATTLAARTQLCAISLPVRSSTVDNYRIVNNVMEGFDNSPIMTDGTYLTGTIDSLYFKNNITYQNGNSNDPKWWGITPTNILSSNNLKTDPLFVSATDFRLQTSSPAINAGLDVGEPYLYTAPDIGVYEYVIENPAVVGTVVMDAPYNTTASGITIYAYVASDGGGTVSERGIVYGTSANPTIAGSKIAYGSGLGVYKCVLAGLTSSTTYYLRGYVTNEAGTAYSNQVIINTTYSSKAWDKSRMIRDNGKVVLFK